MVRGLATSHRTVSFAMCWQHWFETADITIVLANKINIPFSPHFERDWDFRAGARERCAWLTRVSGEDLTFLHSISGWCRHRWMGLIALHFGWRVQGGGAVSLPLPLCGVWLFTYITGPCHGPRHSPGAATAVIASHGGAEKGATILLALSRLYLCPVNEQNICQMFSN